MKLGVIGCGKVGFNTLKAFCKKGNAVLGFDISKFARDRISTELGSESLAVDFGEMGTCDLVFICVPTEPVEHSGECDLSVLENTVRAFSALEMNLEFTCSVLVQRSTAPPGTARMMAKLLRKTAYAVNPSFLRKETQWEDSISPERVAIAGDDSTLELLRQVYKSFDSPVFASNDYEVIELLKYVENATDAVLISLWNEFLTISDSLGISRDNFIKIMDSFVERDKFRTSVRVPGQAFGMWCLPKDLSALVHRFKTVGVNVLRAALSTNSEMREKWSENPYGGSRLFFYSGGSLRLTAFGKQYLRTVRIPQAS